MAAAVRVVDTVVEVVPLTVPAIELYVPLCALLWAAPVIVLGAICLASVKAAPE